MMAHPQFVDLTILNREPTYKGSVQDLFQTEFGGKSCFLCRTSESGSVFDVGTIFSVPKSDILRTVVRHAIYTALEDPLTWQALSDDDFRHCFCTKESREDFLFADLLDEIREKGVRTHHIGMVDSTGKVFVRHFPSPPSNLVLIEQFPVYRPTQFAFWGRYAWDYHEYSLKTRKILSLENVFRLGCPGGSSLLHRFDSIRQDEGAKRSHGFLASLGLVEEPRSWGRFKDLFYDSATKHEPEDRHLSWQESVHLSGVSAELYKRAIRTLVYCTIYVSKFFRNLGFDLWDIKWEVAVDGDEVVVVDTIDPDSIRVTGSIEYGGRSCFVHFNKQSIRDYYRIVHEQWYESINEAKKLSRTDPKGRSFLDIYRDGVAQGNYPPIPEYDERFGEIQSRKYSLIAEPLLAEDEGRDLRGERLEVMREEIDFYRSVGKIERFLEENATSVLSQSGA